MQALVSPNCLKSQVFAAHFSPRLLSFPSIIQSNSLKQNSFCQKMFILTLVALLMLLLDLWLLLAGSVYFYTAKPFYTANRRMQSITM